MKYFSFKILILCTLLPPALYISSLTVIENEMGKRYARQIEDVLIGDAAPLLNGSVRLQDAVAENIGGYLNNRTLLSWGARLTVTVTSGQDKLLYPVVLQDENNNLVTGDPLQTAAENYRLMNAGLTIKTDLAVGHNTLLANGILTCYILIALLILYRYYRIGARKAGAEEDQQKREIGRLARQAQAHRQQLAVLDQDREKLTTGLAALKQKLEKEKNRANRNEDALIEDIVTLEGQVAANLSLQEKQQEEIAHLKEKIRSLEGGKRRKKASGIEKKRFKALYKNVSVHRRALDGFSDLTEDMKIKCETLIHQLNENPERVTVKRKVFGKKNRETVLEAIFAYKGRLYFRTLSDNKIEILAVGTKNSQAKELAFLDKL